MYSVFVGWIALPFSQNLENYGPGKTSGLWNGSQNSIINWGILQVVALWTFLLRSFLECLYQGTELYRHHAWVSRPTFLPTLGIFVVFYFSYSNVCKWYRIVLICIMWLMKLSPFGDVNWLFAYSLLWSCVSNLFPIGWPVLSFLELHILDISKCSANLLWLYSLFFECPLKIKMSVENRMDKCGILS